MMKESRVSITEGRPLHVFFYFTVPWVLGMISTSSAGIVDGIFLGNYVGKAALAAVNLTLPVTSLLFGFVIMLVVGGTARCGKYIGEGNRQAASEVFTKVMVAIVVSWAVVATLGTVFLRSLVELLGANEELLQPTMEYLGIILPMSGFFVTGVAMSFFVRTDGHPVRASIALYTVTVVNIFLDWLLVARLGWGIRGAAYATMIAHAMEFVVLLPHFFSKAAQLKFVRIRRGWMEVLHAAYNGFSELVNSTSAAIVTFLFNLIMVSKAGTAGVAAFTVVHYLLFFEQMICYGIADALGPLVSTNFGAREPKRIASFVRISLGAVVTTGIVLVCLMLAIPEKLAGLFLKNSDVTTLEITLEFMKYFWPAFLLNGINIILSSYFTSMQKPTPSAIVAVVRSLIFPLSLLYLLPVYFGDAGIYSAVPVAEFLTLFVAMAFLGKNRPKRIVLAAGPKPVLHH